MARIRILTDTAADLPHDVAEAYGVTCIPMTVNLGNRDYMDGVDITSAAFYRMVEAGTETPRTAQPNPPTFAKAFETALRTCDHVVYVGLSSGLSGAVQSALMGRTMVPDPVCVTVIDTLGASMGQGLIALKAAELANAGAEVAEVVRETEAYRDRLQHVFTINTLNFARRSGRVSAVSALAAGLLDVKPVLRMDMAGHIVSLDKARGRKKALRRLLDEVEAKGRNLAGTRMGISAALAPTEAAELAEVIKRQYGAPEVIVGEIGPTVGSHVGPGTVAIFFEGEPGRP